MAPDELNPLTAPLLEAEPDGEAGGALEGPPASAPRKPSVSFFGSVFNLCAATLGAGALSIPYAISLTGSVLGCALLLVAAVAALLSIDLLVGSLRSSRCETYEDVTATLIGRRTALCVELCILAFCFGTCVAYLIALGDIMEVLLLEQGHLPAWAPHARSHWMCIVWAAVLLPVSLPHSLAALQHCSALGTLALCVLVAAVCVHAANAEPAAAPRPRPPVTINHLSSALSIIMFAFTSQVNVPEVYAELRAPTVRRMRGVAASAVSIAMVLYVAIGLAAFSEFGRVTKSDVLNNYDVWASVRDRAMLPAFVFMACTIAMAYPLNVFPARVTVLAMMRPEEHPSLPETAPFARHVGVTLGITGLSLAVAVFAPGINVVFQLLGGTASAFVCFCVPGVLAIRTHSTQLGGPGAPHRVACAYALVIGGALVGIVATVETVRGMLGDGGER